MATLRSPSASFFLVGAGVLSVLVGGGSLATTPKGRAAIAAKANNFAIVHGVKREREPKTGDYWGGCDDARAAGTAPIYSDEPGYRPEMDGNSDGIACEPHRD